MLGPVAQVILFPPSLYCPRFECFSTLAASAEAFYAYTGYHPIPLRRVFSPILKVEKGHLGGAQLSVFGPGDRQMLRGPRARDLKLALTGDTDSDNLQIFRICKVKHSIGKKVFELPSRTTVVARAPPRPSV